MPTWGADAHCPRFHWVDVPILYARAAGAADYFAGRARGIGVFDVVALPARDVEDVDPQRQMPVCCIAPAEGFNTVFAPERTVLRVSSARGPR